MNLWINQTKLLLLIVDFVFNSSSEGMVLTIKVCKKSKDGRDTDLSFLHPGVSREEVQKGKLPSFHGLETGLSWSEAVGSNDFLAPF